MEEDTEARKNWRWKIRCWEKPKEEVPIASLGMYDSVYM